MSINTTKICDDLEIADEGTTVIAYNKNNEKVIVPYGVLEWRNEYDDGDDWDLPLFLKLSEISSQLIAKGYKPTFLFGGIWDCLEKYMPIQMKKITLNGKNTVKQ